MPGNSEEPPTQEVERITELLYSSVVPVRQEAARGLVDTTDSSLVIALIEDALSRTRDQLKGKELTERLQRWSEGMRLLTLAGREKPASLVLNYARLTTMSILIDIVKVYDEDIRSVR